MYEIHACEIRITILWYLELATVDDETGSHKVYTVTWLTTMGWSDESQSLECWALSEYASAYSALTDHELSYLHLTCQQSIGTHNLYKVRVLNLETIMNTDYGCDCFDLPISEVL